MNNLAVPTSPPEAHLALPLYEETLALKKARLGPHHPETLATMTNLGWGSSSPASSTRPAAPGGGPGTAKPGSTPTTPIPSSHEHLATSYQDAGQLDLALRSWRRPWHAKSRLGPDHPDTLGSMGDLTLCYRAAGQLDRASPILVEAASLWKRKAGANAPDIRSPWAISAWSRSNPGCGLGPNRRCGNAWRSRNRGSPRVVRLSHPFGARRGHSRPEAIRRGRTLAPAGYEGMARRGDKIPLRDRVRVNEALDRLIALAEATNRADDAKAWKAERAKWPANPPKPGKEKK